MVNKRLIRLCGSSKRYIALTVAVKWISLLCNIGIFFVVGRIMDIIIAGSNIQIVWIAAMITGLLIARFVCDISAQHFSHMASAQAKKTLRNQVYRKLLALGIAYTSHATSAGIVQAAGEGIESLDNYFGKYLPQLLYALAAPLTLFAALALLSFKASLILVLCVPLIPLSIIAFMKIAKKLMKRYWNVYTDLGDAFLENLQGLTTLKLFGADSKKHHEMDAQSERFRRITMKVLSMQLHSITLMDVFAYGGAAIGGIIAMLEFGQNMISMGDFLTIILLSAEFFLPLRMLGSYFHVATGSVAASDKIFELLDILEEDDGDHMIDRIERISFQHVSFFYGIDRLVLNDINLETQKNDYVAIVGESGSGKSTLASLMMKMQIAKEGRLLINGEDIRNIKNEGHMQHFGLLTTNSHIFDGTIRDNLLLGNAGVTERQMYDALGKARMSSFVENLKDGLDTNVGENGAFLSGGQKQRLALARMLLSDKPVMIFDEAASSIDCESEEMIWKAIRDLKGEKTVIIISHRLASVKDADCIYVMKDGGIAEEGKHDELIAACGIYHDMWMTQRKLESIRGDAS